VAASSANARSVAARHVVGRYLPPTHVTCHELLAAVSHQAEKGVVGLKNLTVAMPEADPDDVGVDQTPDLGLAFFELTVQTGILQGNRGLGRQQRQHREPGRREDVGGEMVFEVEHPDEFGLIDQRHTEQGTDVLLPEARIRRERVRHGGIAE
jgi:hypothetical protein